MGRSLSWYIIYCNIEHDKTKQVCLDFEFEPEQDDFELKEKFSELVNPDFKKYDFDNDDNNCCTNNGMKAKKISEYYKEINLNWNSIKYNDIICPKCLMYKSGWFNKNVVIDSIGVSHSYSNPIWDSDWSISDIHMCSSKSNFIRRFSKKHMYAEVSDKDIEYAFRTLESLGEPIRHSDREAYDETIKVLDFLKKYSNRDDVYIIFQNDY